MAVFLLKEAYIISDCLQHRNSIRQFSRTSLICISGAWKLKNSHVVIHLLFICGYPTCKVVAVSEWSICDKELGYLVSDKSLSQTPYQHSTMSWNRGHIKFLLLLFLAGHSTSVPHSNPECRRKERTDSWPQKSDILERPLSLLFFSEVPPVNTFSWARC